MSKPMRVRGCQRSGTNSGDWSMVLITRFSTQAVIASGTRISNPVIKYLRIELSFLCQVANNHAAGRNARYTGLVLPAGALLAAGASALGASVLAAVSAGPVETPVAGGVPPRKSVAYQPVPFSWKPAAVSCFLNDGLPQDRQTVSCGSEIFCKTSLAKPHSSQR